MGDSRYENCIAIVGMAGRFPGAENIEELWQNVCDGICSLTQFSEEEVAASIRADDPGSIRYRLEEAESGNWVPVGYAMKDVDKFDAAFFGYTPAEAELLDPQQRLSLETAWAAIEDAGYVPDACPGTVGVFAGAALSRYFLKNIYSHRDIIYSPRDLTAGIGNEPDYVTNRISYKLDLQGPAVTVQTACSTSLVAVHMACQSLIAGESDMCLAGGVLVSVPGGGYLYREGSMTSPDGLVRSFDEQAEGTVFSDGGVAMVCLKRMEDALADGDHVYAVIRGSAVGNDGGRKAGYAAPGVAGQVKVVREALAVAEVDPSTIGYMESHGTGTPIGDPIEIAALTQAWKEDGGAQAKCALGSIKPNVGHLATVAGVASLIKAALVVKTGTIPPLVNFSSPNRRIDFADTPFWVPTERTQWSSASTGPRRASVSSFGIGGTNAHLVLEEPPRVNPRSPERGPFVLPISGRTDAALQRQREALAAWLERRPDANLADVAHTLRVGRKAFACRDVVIGSSAEALIARLRESRSPDRTSARAKTGKVAWMFSGQGAQYVGMTAGLGHGFPEYRRVLKQCVDHLARCHGLDLEPLLSERQDAATEELGSQLAQTEMTQPALFAVEYALASQLKAFGLEADYYIGHSLGEFVAACLAGTFGLKEALDLVALRGRLMQRMRAGSMLAVSASGSDIAHVFGDSISLAAENAPGSCVVSGESEAIERVRVSLEAEGRTCRPLVTSHAFHSPMMAPAVAEFEAAVRAASPKAPSKPWVSNVSGALVEEAQAVSPEYWSQHLLGTVLFQRGVECLLSQGVGVFIEVGPGNALATFARRTLAQRKASALVAETVRHARIKADDTEVLLLALGKLYGAGVPVDWTRICAPNGGRRVPLPSYAFERDRHWLEPGNEGLGSTESERRPEREWYSVPAWRRGRRTQRRVQVPEAFTGSTVVVVGPGSEWLEAVASQVTDAGAQVHRWIPEQSAPLAGAKVVDLDSAAAVERALTTIVGDGDESRRLVIVEAGAGPEALGTVWDPEALDLDGSFFRALAIAQGMANVGVKTPPVWLTVVAGAVHVLDEDLLHPDQATRIGVHLCVGHELPDWSTRVLDIGHDGALNREPEHTAAAIVDELRDLFQSRLPQIGAPGKVVALRQGYRWSAGCEEIESMRPDSPTVRDGGNYLVTGGVGGLGLEMGAWLAERGAATVVLMTRGEFPDRRDYDRWQREHASAERTSQRISKILEIEALGARVRVVRADVSDPKQVAEVVRYMGDEFGGVHGVIHSAGVAGGGVLQLKQREDALQVLLPKVVGAHAICSALEGSRPDFVVLFSSIFGFVGGVGQIDYAAANAFLDTYAHYARRRYGFPVVSVGWGPFSEVGMAARGTAGAGRRHEGRLLPGADPLLQREVSRTDDAAEFGAFVEPNRHWVLAEHRVAGMPTLPGTATLEMVRQAYFAFTGQAFPVFRDVMFLRPLFVEPDGGAEVRISLSRRGTADVRFEVACLSDDDVRQSIASGTLAQGHFAAATFDLDAIRASCQREALVFDPDTSAQLADNDFLLLGRHWQVVKRIGFGIDSMMIELQLPEDCRSDATELLLHPSLLDMATGPTLGHLLSRMDLPLSGEYLPYSYGAFSMRRGLCGPEGGVLMSHVRFNRAEDGGETLMFDIELLTGKGELIGSISDFTLRLVSGLALTPRQNPTKVGAPGLTAWSDTIAPSEGRLAMSRIVGALEEPNLMVAPVSLGGMIEQLRVRLGAAGSEQGPVVRNEDAVVDLPQNEVQAAIVRVFEATLGVAPIGILDNFFELGGDSVIGIQIVSRCKADGLVFKPADLFEHETIAALSEVVSTNAAWSASGPAKRALNGAQVLHHVPFRGESAPFVVIPVHGTWRTADVEAHVKEVLTRAPWLRFAPDMEQRWISGELPSIEIWQANEHAYRERLTAEGELQGACVVRVVVCDAQVIALVVAMHPALHAGVGDWHELAMRLVPGGNVDSAWRRGFGAEIVSLGGPPIQIRPPMGDSEASFEHRVLKLESDAVDAVMACARACQVTAVELLVTTLRHDLDCGLPIWVATSSSGELADTAESTRCGILHGGDEPPVGKGAAAHLLAVKVQVRKLAPQASVHDEAALREVMNDGLIVHDAGRVEDGWGEVDWSASEMTLPALGSGISIALTPAAISIGLSGDPAWIDSQCDVLPAALHRLAQAVMADRGGGALDFMSAEFQDAGLPMEDVASILGKLGN